MHFLIYEIARRVEIKPVNPIHIVYAIYDIPHNPIMALQLLFRWQPLGIIISNAKQGRHTKQQ